MSLLIPSDISEIIDEQVRILKNFDEANNKSTQLHKHSSHIVHDVTDADTSEQIPTQLSEDGTPPAELMVALTSLEAELEKIAKAQAAIRTNEGEIRRGIETRRNLIIGVGFVIIVVITLAVYSMFFSKQTPISTEQALTVPPTSASQPTTEGAGELSSTSASKPTQVTATATPRNPTPTFTSRPKSESTTVAQEAVSISSFPFALTPAAVAADAKPLAIDFLIESIEIGEDAVRFHVTIKRHSGSSPLPWYSDESRKGEIYLAVGSQRYRLIEMGGLFIQDTTLQPGQSYTGWLAFEPPSGAPFTFHYPDVKSIEIDLKKTGIKADVDVSEASTPTPTRKSPTSTLTLECSKVNNGHAFDGGLLIGCEGFIFYAFYNDHHIEKVVMSEAQARANQKTYCGEGSENPYLEWGLNLAFCKAKKQYGKSLGNAQPYVDNLNITFGNGVVNFNGEFGLHKFIITGDRWDFAQ